MNVKNNKFIKNWILFFILLSFYTKGTDVLKCIALGAKCVFLGRGALYANAAEG